MKECDFDKFKLYEKVKFVEGEKFTTVEETTQLSQEEFLRLIAYLEKDERLKKAGTLSILVPSSHHTDKLNTKLVEAGFVLDDMTVIVKRDLSDLSLTESESYRLIPMKPGMEDTFKHVWAQAMTNSLNGSSNLTIDDQLKSVEKELGPNFRRTCLIAYEGEQPIGVVMPHIEPGTIAEGRLFYFGLIPEARGKGKSKVLHRQALAILRQKFDAAYYVGSTSYHNTPMLKLFAHNGCVEIDRSKVFSRS
ncbi:GNAT family N-acetyltransferase [Halobacillus shinanisalinarum]|uniref:GNAT family N-acetyltransferase n=1 Tax=Halobacillus shinanisalinarum TaxID=2932258 RepID=A0ABY4H6Q1_9BACI|nr:GNAT family N-acetyltransferase [Halobacillus shinanisalinarum]UOQ95267.1 GNAT family N-acetyltransferase [Halobacillus shinanisalinarum]